MATTIPKEVDREATFRGILNPGRIHIENVAGFIQDCGAT